VSVLPQVWSCGGGTQSAAIAALIVQGRLPKPDVSLMVDTGRERSSTWAFVHGVLVPALASAGVELRIVRTEDFDDIDPFNGQGTVLLPMFTTQDATGKLENYCSAYWKREITARYLRSIGIPEACLWIGISLDEKRRAKTLRRKRFTIRYPLLMDVPMRRFECVSLVESMGWGTPPRSSCWMCPNHSDAEWREIRDNDPADFQAAVELERDIREQDPHAYLHGSCVPLDRVEFDAAENEAAGCDGIFCFV
jgi:hypothetical protein